MSADKSIDSSTESDTEPSSDKKDKNASNTSFYERSEAKSGLGVCYKCGGKGHKANECTTKPGTFHTKIGGSIRWLNST